MAMGHSALILFGMFRSYFDAAGGEDQGFIVVAGWVSSVTLWERFEVDWRLALARAGVPYFHMKEFSQSKGPFKSWKSQEQRRANFIGVLAAIIRDYGMFGTGTYLDFNIFNNVNKAYCLREWEGNEYSLTARDCAAMATRWAINQNPPALPMEYIFEDGDKGKGFLQRLMEMQGYPSPIFRPSRDRKAIIEGHETEIKGVIPLQAADFAAYELRRARDLLHRNAWAEEHRRSFLALNSVNTEWHTYADREDRLVGYCEMQGIPKRSNETPCKDRLR